MAVAIQVVEAAPTSSNLAIGCLSGGIWCFDCQAVDFAVEQP